MLPTASFSKLSEYKKRENCISMVLSSANKSKKGKYNIICKKWRQCPWTPPPVLTPLMFVNFCLISASYFLYTTKTLLSSGGLFVLVLEGDFTEKGIVQEGGLFLIQDKHFIQMLYSFHLRCFHRKFNVTNFESLFVLVNYTFRIFILVIRVSWQSWNIFQKNFSSWVPSKGSVSCTVQKWFLRCTCRSVHGTYFLIYIISSGSFPCPKNTFNKLFHKRGGLICNLSLKMGVNREGAITVLASY